MSRIHLVIGSCIVLSLRQVISQATKLPPTGGDARYTVEINCLLPLGMEDGRIKDQNIRATSSLAFAGATNARLNHADGYGGWCPDQERHENDTNPIPREFIQVHLPSHLRVRGLVTQSRASGVEKVERFWISYLWQGVRSYKWYFGAGSNRIKVFEGNEYGKMKLSVLRPPVVADAIRIIPRIYPPSKQVCLRFELLGCPIKSGIVTYVMLQGNSLDGRYNFTDSSYDGLTKGFILFSGLGMLTDGHLGNEDFTANNGLGWIGWNIKETPKPYIIFEFLRERIFDSATFHCNVKDKSHIKLFSKVEISFGTIVWEGIDLIPTYEFKTTQIFEPEEISGPSSSINHNITIKLDRRVGKSLMFNFTYSGQWILVSEVTFNSEPLGKKSSTEFSYVTSTTHSPYTISSTLSGESEIYEDTVAPSSERLDSVFIIISSLTALGLGLVLLGTTWAIQRKRRQENDVTVTAVESDQSQAEILIPVGVTSQWDVSKSNEFCNLDTDEPPAEEYETIERFRPTIMVTSDSTQISEYAQASSASSHSYTPLERSKEEERIYVNQIKTPEYVNMYMPLTNMSGGDSCVYGSLLKSEEDENVNTEM